MFFNFIKSFFNIENNIVNIDFLLSRSAIAFIFSFIFTFIGLKILINIFKKHKFFQPVRFDVPLDHFRKKRNIPTLGGLVCYLSILFSSLFFCDLKDIYMWSVLLLITLFACVGLYDDLMKLSSHSSNGIKGEVRLLLEVLFCGLTIMLLTQGDSTITNEKTVFIPLIKYTMYIGVLIIPFFIFVVVGSSNAVNLTDGLDGLAIFPIMLSAFGLFIIAIFSGYGIDAKFIKTLNFDNPSELAVMCSSVIGSGLAFLSFNRYPARVFMGDVGSLMFGAFLGITAVCLRYEVFFAIIGLVFVVEALSDIIQVSSLKMFGKGVFKMAPIHHTFERMGWSEKKVVYTFWLFSFICLVIGLLGVINLG